MRRLLLVLLVAAGVAGAAWLLMTARRAPELPGHGIPLDVARDRAARISALRYEVTFRVPARREDAISAHLRATFTLNDASTPLLFDFAQPPDRLHAMHANGRIVPPQVANDHVIVPAGVLVEGENIVEFEFVAGEAALNRQDEFLYALFVPARASQTMPVFDQPDLKARWRLILNIPPGWTAISNGAETGRVASPDHLGLIFEETAPISTYLFAFAAGKFVAEEAERGHRRFRMLHREPDASKVAKNRDAIFDLHAGALDWLEEYTGIPYPFGKFEFVLIPSFQFGGMEHPGAIYYNASSLLLDDSATQSQRLGRASLIAHETAHMWFGDLVTMRWFNDVWMKEVFANFMAAKIVNPSFPDVNHDLRFLLQHYPAAYEVDRTEGANPIRQDLANLNEAGSLYGAIIYQKAPIVMRHLERLLGADALRDGLREYLRGHEFGNADWTDLVRVLDARTPIDLVEWSRAWVEERGRPRIHVGLLTDGPRAMATFRTEDPLGRNLVWPQTLGLAAGRGSRVALRAEQYLPGDAAWPLEAAGVTWVLPTAGGLGYGDFVLERAQLEALATALPDLDDALTRGAALVTLWESMLEGRLPPAAMRTVLARALPREADELNAAQMLEYTRALYWRFTAADDRGAVSRPLETMLRAGLDRAETTSRKAAWFSTLRSVATTADTAGWLERVWRREVSIPGLPLSETDYADLALELAVRDVPEAEAILRGQLERFTSEDRRARFAFVMPALSRDASEREAFFRGLFEVERRRREAWVLEAVRYLHHPLRAPVSVALVRDALGLVREIQQTGDIFFPKRWADATLGGYQSPRTAADVRAFIDSLPADYPPRLRWVLLSAADPLFRAAAIAHQ